MRRHVEQIRVHIPLVQHLRRRAMPGLVWWHAANGAFYGGARQGALMKALGVRPGVADLVFLYEGRFYALELKREKGARASAEQRQFLDDVRMAGGIAAVCSGLDEALATLERWGLLRGATEFALDMFTHTFKNMNTRDSIADTSDIPPKVSRGPKLTRRKTKSKVAEPS